MVVPSVAAVCVIVAPVNNVAAPAAPRLAAACAPLMPTFATFASLKAEVTLCKVDSAEKAVGTMPSAKVICDFIKSPWL